MNYDTHDESGESSPTIEDLHGDAAVPVGGCHEFGDTGGFPTEAEMERMHFEHLDDSRRAEAALARRCVATGEPQQAPAPVYFRDVVADGPKWRASVIRNGIKVPVPGRFNTFDGADAMAAVRVRSMQEEDRGGKAA